MEVLKQPDVASQLSSQHKKDQAIKRNMLLITLSSLKFLLRQGLAIRGHEKIEGNLMQLLLLQVQQCSHLVQYINNKQYLSNEIVNEMIALMSNVVVRQIISKIWEAPFYSIIADEATDISQMEQLCWRSGGWIATGIHEKPLELIQVQKTYSKTLHFN